MRLIVYIAYETLTLQLQLIHVHLIAIWSIVLEVYNAITQSCILFASAGSSIAICDKLYRDFICWTTQGIHIERIKRDYGKKFNQSWIVSLLVFCFPTLLCPNFEGIADEADDGSDDMQLQAEANEDK